MGTESDHRPDQPHSARMYDYFLGGKDHYAADEQAARAVLGVWPGIQIAARANRAFMRRSVEHLAREEGIRQFLDIGTGIPTEPNLHQIAQEVAPQCRIVYTDNDPLVLAHARALMTGTPQGRTTYIHADATDPAAILDSPKLRETVDLSEPVAVSLIALLHFIEHDAERIVATLVDALAPGSYLTICTATADFDPDQVATAREIYRARGITAQDRTREEVAKFFHGLELLDPGIVPPHRWRPDLETPASHDAKVSCYAGVARKP
ncbi:SAM-dependent methyltransferase [Nocardia sp. NPDC003963]